MNDRALRHVVVGMGKGNGPLRETLRHHRRERGDGHPLPRQLREGPRGPARAHRRGHDHERQARHAGDLGAAPAMTALLLDALMPNLVQTREGTPGGRARRALREHRPRVQLHPRDAPRARATATTWSPRRASASTSAAEKFLDIKCRVGEMWPRGVVLVATHRALKMHGGVAVSKAGEPNVPAPSARASTTSTSTSRPSATTGSPRWWPSTAFPTTPRRSARRSRSTPPPVG
jgi:formate--tetrahydrofolate ligase